MAHLGFVGLGTMGGHMVKRLLDKGHTVIGHNRTRSKSQWLIDAGMQWADTPRQVAESADLVFTMVTDGKALKAIVDGPDGVIAGLTPGKILVDMSTVTPAASREVVERVTAAGAQMLDAPVSGSVITLQQGKLSVMVGGSREAFDRARPVLQDVGPKVTYVGAEKSRISRETAVDVLTHSVIGSPMVQYRGPFVLKMPDQAWFNVDMMQKDMNLAIDMGQRLGVPLPTTAVTNEFLTAARGMGLASHDFAIMFEVLARMAGVNR